MRGSSPDRPVGSSAAGADQVSGHHLLGRGTSRRADSKRRRAGACRLDRPRRSSARPSCTCRRSGSGRPNSPGRTPPVRSPPIESAAPATPAPGGRHPRYPADEQGLPTDPRQAGGRHDADHGCGPEGQAEDIPEEAEAVARPEGGQQAGQRRHQHYEEIHRSDHGHPRHRDRGRSDRDALIVVVILHRGRREPPDELGARLVRLAGPEELLGDGLVIRVALQRPPVRGSPPAGSPLGLSGPCPVLG